MNTSWDLNVSTSILEQFVSQHQVDEIFTFDSQGVSGHPNHIASYNAARAFSTTQGALSISVHTLVSLPLFRKYWGIVEYLSLIFTKNEVFCDYSPVDNWRTMSLHTSQFVWYRKLFVLFSSYSYCNIWIRNSFVCFTTFGMVEKLEFLNPFYIIIVLGICCWLSPFMMTPQCYHAFALSTSYLDVLFRVLLNSSALIISPYLR